MPNGGGTPNTERATFIKDVAYSMFPNFSDGCSSGTGIWMAWVPGAIKGTFGFSSANPENGSSSTFIIADNTVGRVTILSGFTQQGDIFGIPIAGGVGHAWVCDGVRGYFGECYQGAVEYHMNWGWNGSYNGWFAHSRWDPTPTTPAQNYEYFQQVVWNIHP
jgi:Peptidase C10 family